MCAIVSGAAYLPPELVYSCQLDLADEDLLFALEASVWACGCDEGIVLQEVTVAGAHLDRQCHLLRLFGRSESKL